MQKQLPPSLPVGSPSGGLLKKTIKRHGFILIAFFSAIEIVLFNALVATAQSANGFGQAVDAVKSNSIVSQAGGSASDLMSFPFVMAGIILLLTVILAIIVAIAALLSGRDWATPFLNIFAMIGLILLGGGVLAWLVASGMFGTGGTTAVGG
jgi:NADH:ubiquinone oxidoreductase subunit 6 (subunit J)